MKTYVKVKAIAGELSKYEKTFPINVDGKNVVLLPEIATIDGKKTPYNELDDYFCKSILYRIGRNVDTIPVRDFHTLLVLAKSGFSNYALCLKGGCFSRKIVRYVNKSTIRVTNCIDGTKQTLTEEQVYDTNITNIGRGLENNAFLLMVND